MKNIIITIALHFCLQNIFAQNVQLTLINVPKELALYEQFTVDCQLINNDTIPISVEYSNTKLYCLDKSGEKQSIIGSRYNLNSVVLKSYKKSSKLEPGDTIILSRATTFFHPILNDALEEDFWDMQSIQIGASINYRKTNAQNIPLTQAISPTVAIKIKPFPKEEQAYFDWLNTNNIFIRAPEDYNLNSYLKDWNRKSSKNPKRFHNITLKELDKAIKSFPNSLLLAETIDAAIGRGLVPRSHIIKAFLYIGQIKNQGLIKKHEPVVAFICNILNDNELLDSDSPDHTCEAYKTLAPLYGLPD